MANLSLLDIAKMNNSDPAVGLIEESIQASPEAMSGSARTIKGTNYKTLHRTSIPTVGFRGANEGVAAVKSVYENKLVETFIVDASCEMDKAVADSYEDGREACIALEASGIMEGSFRAISSQTYYGIGTGTATSQASSPTKGFPGFVDTVGSAMVLDAAGTTASTGSSVWGVIWGPKYAQWVLGQDGELQMGDVREVRLTDSSSNPYDGYRQSILAYVGIQLVNPFAIGQIKNLTADSGKGLTDALLYEFLDKWPSGLKPDNLFMTKRSRRQLRDSRTATNPTGAPAPQPDNFENIPIMITDGIVNTETIV